MKTGKTDNDRLPAKLELRRHFLRAFHRDKPPVVFEACQGSGVLWKTLREEFTLARLWGCDLKPRPGRLKMDSSRIVGQQGFRADVVDVDTYGNPWEHWLNLLPNLTAPCTVFLTFGMLKKIGDGTVPSLVQRHAVGLIFKDFDCPPSLLAAQSVRKHILEALLAAPLSRGLEIVEAREAPPGRSARYFGLHIRPASA